MKLSDKQKSAIRKKMNAAIYVSSGLYRLDHLNLNAARRVLHAHGSKENLVKDIDEFIESLDGLLD